MSAELAIVAGISFITYMLAHYGFKLNDSAREVNKRIAVILLFMSLVFLNLVMFTIFDISQNTTASYLESSVLTTGLQVLMWLTLILIVGYWFSIMFAMVRYTIKWMKSWQRKQKQTYKDL